MEEVGKRVMKSLPLVLNDFASTDVSSLSNVVLCREQ